MRDSFFGKHLDLILEDGIVDDPYDAAAKIVSDLEKARRIVIDLEQQLAHAMDLMCGKLAMAVRKNKSGLNVSLGRGACKIGYRSKYLTLKPDPTKRMWAIDSNDPTFARRFFRNFGAYTGLISDLDPIAEAIARFFAHHYKSLGEEIEGIGSILIDDVRSSTIDLSGFIRGRDKLLREAAPALLSES